jgi:flagellar hook-associated protein 2
MGSSATPITFNGSSTFSSSFQQVLTRAVQIASMPLTQMQNTVSDLSGQQATLSSLEATFSSLQNSIQNIASTINSTLAATVSDPSVLSATATQNAQAGTYSIVVDTLGSSTSTLSKANLTTVTDPTSQNISSSSPYTLTVNKVTYNISPAGGSLDSLATAINNAGAGVQATIVNVGSTSSPDYRLAIGSNNLGADAISLTDSGNNSLLDTLQTGTDATYKVNGMTTDISSTSRQITLAPGLTVNLLQPSTSGQATTITVGNNYSALQSTLSDFATAYNSAVVALAAQRGQNGGALTGQSIIFSLSNTLSNLSLYSGSGSGSVTSLADLGLNLDSTGHLSFDATAFNSQSPGDVQQFLGTTTSGGFLQAANDALTAVADSTSGSITNDISNVQGQITSENNLIAQEQTRITDLQTNLTQELSVADAAIATLESQKTYFTNLFAAERSEEHTSELQSL